MKIGYLTFGRDDFGYGLALCLSKLDGYEVFRVSPKTAKLVDVLLFSVFWWEHIYLVAQFLREAGILKDKYPRPRIIIGGFNSFNPVPLLAYCDAVVVGDGEDVIKDAVNGNFDSPSIYTDGKESCVWYNVKELEGFCHETNGIGRIEIARGCKYRCRFCAVSHLKPFREVPYDKLESVIQNARPRRLALFAPEPTLHSRNNEITELCESIGKVRLDSDVRLDRIHKRIDKTSVVRVGIEGISERLRKSVNKGYTNEQIIEAVRSAIKEGRGGMFMYFILDLPGESEADWEEFGYLMRKIGEIPGANEFLLKPSPSVFLPTPHTPMENDGIHWDVDCRGKWISFFRPIDGVKAWEVKMSERTRVFSPHSRLLSILSTRCGEEFIDIEKALYRSGAIGYSKAGLVVKDKRGIEKVIQRFHPIEYYTGERTGGPWEVCKVGV